MVTGRRAAQLSPRDRLLRVLASPLGAIFFLLLAEAVYGLLSEAQDIGLVSIPGLSVVFEAMAIFCIFWSATCAFLLVRQSGLQPLPIWTISLALYWILYAVQVWIWGDFQRGPWVALLFLIFASQDRNDFLVVSTWIRDFLLLFVALSVLVGLFFGVTDLAGVKHGLDLFNFEIGFRGLTSHPNLLGALVAFSLYLEFVLPSRRFQPVAVVFLLTTGLLTFSFGAGAALAAALAVAGLVWLREDSRRRKGVALTSLALMAGAMGVLGMVQTGRFDSLGSFTTGRTFIWASITRENHDSLLFGAGLSPLLEVAPGANAHNDLLQALTVAGILGVALLGSSILLRILYRGKPQHRVNPRAMGGLTFLGVLGLVETPLAPSFSGLFLLVLLVFGRDYGNAERPEVAET